MNLLQGARLQSWKNEHLAQAILNLAAGRWLDVEKLEIGSGGTVSLKAASIDNADIATDAAIALSKLSSIATDKLLGRSTSGTGAIEEITCTAAGRALIDDANAAAQRTTLGVDAAGTAASLLATHEADTTSVHGIADTAALYAAGGTDVAVADGGTGASTAAGARANLAVPGIIVAQRVNNTVTGANFQNCQTVSIPGGTLGSTGGVRFELRCRRTTGVGNLTFRVQYGGTTVLAFAATTLATTKISGVLFGDGGASAQRAHGEESRGATAPVTGTSAVDSTSSQNLTIDVDLATDADVVTCDWISVEILK